MSSLAYVGRFAPTPSGELHFGSIVAALGSYLQAKHKHGNWRLRIDDLDISRSRPGIDGKILAQLEDLGLHWDGDVMYQSTRNKQYKTALSRLDDQGAVYYCQCTRKQVGVGPYLGTCRNLGLKPATGRSIRINTDKSIINIEDGLQGSIQSNLSTDSGDFIVYRADGLFAYHLAVVIDDAAMGVTEVVRGADLLDTTAAQVFLHQLLDLPTPRYVHLPVAIDQNGKKLSKRDQAITISGIPAEAVLLTTLAFLGQSLPDSVEDATKDELLAWAVEHWDTSRIPTQKTITVAG